MSVLQIVEALGRKVTFGSSVDLGALAEATDGFSGADLQALVYNAHLEVVHDAIAALADSNPDSKERVNGAGAGAGAGPDVRYTILGTSTDEGGGGGKVLSRAEESAFQRRVCPSLSELDFLDSSSCSQRL